MRILTEASGSLISAYIIRAIQEAGHTALASDIDGEIAARFLADGFLQMPRNADPQLWKKTTALLVANKVDVVFPSFDETLPGWAERQAQLLKQHQIHVIVSPPGSIRICRDKWLTYKFFKACGAPTPATSLKQIYPLVKPRLGRGSQGVCVPDRAVPMKGMLSQQFLQGQEFTVDVFCDRRSNPIYIVPRKRLQVTAGKSLAGIVVDQPEITHWVKVICRNATFHGPINLQCFLDAAGQPWFTEVNPRLGGGMALSFAATENWIGLAVRHFVEGARLSPKPVAYGLRMFRYYAEVLYPEVNWGRARFVGFDLDGTLYDEFDFIRQAYRPIAAKFARLCHQPAREIYSAMLDRWLDKGSSYNRIFEEVLQRARLRPPAAARAVAEAVESFRACNPKLVLPARVGHLLHLLSQRYELFLVTDGQPRLQRAKVAALGLDRWFRKENTAISGDYGPAYRKPAVALLDKLPVWRARPAARSVVYFGDREVDRGFASNAGFRFVEVHCMLPAAPNAKANPPGRKGP